MEDWEKDDAIKSHGYLMKQIHPLLTVELPYPPSVNSMYANVPGKGRVKSKAYNGWPDFAHWTGKAWKYAKPVSVQIKLVKPDKRRRDVDNPIKCCLDFLVRSEAIQDDSQVIKVSSEFVGSGPPCTVIVRAA